MTILWKGYAIPAPDGDEPAADGGVVAAHPVCGSQAAARTADGWEVLCGDVTAGHLLGVWGASDSDVYFVGGVASTTTILHWDGQAISKITPSGSGK